MFYFHEILQRMGLAPDQIRLLRHDNRGLAAWRRGGFRTFGCFASFQRRDPSPYAGVQIACHFLPGPTLANGDATGLFTGITRILDRWEWDGGRLPAIRDDAIIEAEGPQDGLQAFDLEWLDEASPISERVLGGRSAKT